MKRLILILLLLVAAPLPMPAKTVGVTATLATTSGSVRAGARGVVFIFSSDFTGTVNGIAWAGATDAFYSPPIQAGDSFEEIPYTITAGSIRIIVTR